ncbi:MAG: metal-sensitive transcriptional regulator [Bdellovibrionota bacterium]
MLTNEPVKNSKKINLKSSKSPSVLPHDHTPELKRLSRIKGQVEGVERMILDKRYCPDIIQQIKAIRSALKGLEASVIEGHMRHCVNEAILSRDSYIAQQKIEEIILLIKGQS